MNVHIGLMIWKEMKRQNLSAADLAASLAVSKTRMQAILKNTSIDSQMLAKISEIMSFNFFQFYEDNEIFKKIETQEQHDTMAEIELLRALLIEKNKIIQLKDQLLKAQSASILLLEKGQYG